MAPRTKVFVPLFSKSGRFGAARVGQFVVHAGVLPGNPHDGHTLATTIPAISRQAGAARPPFARPHLRPEALRHRADQA
jgi:hypothetical protein